MTLNDYVELNPRVPLVKGETVPFVAMDLVTPGNRWVRPDEERPATGSGSKFSPGDTLFARITPCLENGKVAQYAGQRPGMGSTEFFVLRARANISDPAFVFYFSQKRACLVHQGGSERIFHRYTNLSANFPHFRCNGGSRASCRPTTN